MTTTDPALIIRELSPAQRRALSNAGANGHIGSHWTVIKNLEVRGLVEYPGEPAPWRDRVLTDLGHAVRLMLISAAARSAAAK